MNQSTINKIAEVIKKLEPSIREKIAGRTFEGMNNEKEPVTIQEICDLIRSEVKRFTKDLARLFEEEETEFISDGKKLVPHSLFNKTQFLKNCGVNK